MSSKGKIVRVSIFGIFALTLGVFIGSESKYIDGGYIRDNLYTAIGLSTRPNASRSNATRSNASRSNATNGNATNNNATNGNATNNNATNHNATNANASATDGILYLLDFSLERDTASTGEKIAVNYSVSGAHTIGTTVIFKNDAGDLTFTAPVESIAADPYIVIPSNVVPNKYNVAGVLLTGRNSDGSTFTKQFSKNADNGSNSFNFTSILNVSSNQFNILDSVKLNDISIENKSAKLGEKVNLIIKYEGKINKMKLVFTNSSNKQMSVFVKSIDSKPYFEVPSNVTSDNYNLTGVLIEAEKGTILYDVNEKEGALKLDIVASIEIKGKSDNSYLYNNEDITNEIIAALYKLGNGAEIIVNADANSLINSELFNAIKGKNKKLIINYGDNQIIFNGKDITDSKSIDAAITLGTVSDDADINNYVKKGVLVTFADNGYLPGKALVRIKSTKQMDSILSDEDTHVYYYNELDDNFSEIVTNISKTKEDYYEFEITHNSSYVLVNSKLDSSIVVSDIEPNDFVTWQKSGKIYILIIGCALLLIIAVTIVILLTKKKNKKPIEEKKEETSEDEKKDTTEEKEKVEDKKEKKFNISGIDKKDDK